MINFLCCHHFETFHSLSSDLATVTVNSFQVVQLFQFSGNYLVFLYKKKSLIPQHFQFSSVIFDHYIYCYISSVLAVSLASQVHVSQGIPLNFLSKFLSSISPKSHVQSHDLYFCLPLQSAGLRPDGRKVYSGRQATLSVGELTFLLFQYFRRADFLYQMACLE